MTAGLLNRRELLAAAIAAGISPSCSLGSTEAMRTREIPSSGEALPVIGLGTYRVFDVSGSGEEIESRKAIVDLLIARGGNLLDTSPMYNRSERVIGDVIKAGIDRSKLFLATKVWTDGKAAGENQMNRSAELMNADVIDLMQVHNLRDLDTHMNSIRNWQEDGRIRYSGVTDYRASSLDEVEAAMKKHKPQFIQINYSLGERQAERRVLPVARDLGIAVLINRPFLAGRLFRTVADTPLPGWAASFADSWGQFFLKFVVSHESVTCAIPATSKLQHMTDNLAAGFGALPDDATRDRMAAWFDSL